LVGIFLRRVGRLDDSDRAVDVAAPHGSHTPFLVGLARRLASGGCPHDAYRVMDQAVQAELSPGQRGEPLVTSRFGRDNQHSFVQLGVTRVPRRRLGRTRHHRPEAVTRSDDVCAHVVVLTDRAMGAGSKRACRCRWQYATRRILLGKMDFERGSQTSDAQDRIVIRHRGWSPYTRRAVHYAARCRIS
jgi:hypothetical protein